MDLDKLAKSLMNCEKIFMFPLKVSQLLERLSSALSTKEMSKIIKSDPDNYKELIELIKSEKDIEFITFLESYGSSSPFYITCSRILKTIPISYTIETF